MSDTNEPIEYPETHQPPQSANSPKIKPSKSPKSANSPKVDEPPKCPASAISREAIESAESPIVPQSPTVPDSPKALDSPTVTDSTESFEASPTWVLNIDRSKFTSASGIKKAATLNDKDFSSFHADATAYIKEDSDGLSSKAPRAIKNPAWGDATDQLVVDNGLGQQLWHTAREGFNPDNCLVYPRDRAMIRILVFSLLKVEAQRQARPKKRDHDATEGAAKASPAKINKTHAATDSKTPTTPKDKAPAKTPIAKKPADSPKVRTDTKAPAVKNSVGSPAKKSAAKTPVKKASNTSKEKAPPKTSAVKKSPGVPKTTKPKSNPTTVVPDYKPKVSSGVWPPAEPSMVGSSSLSKLKPKAPAGSESDHDDGASPTSGPTRSAEKVSKGKKKKTPNPDTVVSIVDGERVADPASPSDTLARLLPSDTANLIASRERISPRHRTITPSLTPTDVTMLDSHDRATTEPAASGASLHFNAALAIAATSTAPLPAPPRNPLRHYRTVSFTVHLVSPDPETTLSLSHPPHRQSLHLKPIDLSYHKFIGLVVLGLRSFKAQVAFHDATQCKVRVGNETWTFDKGGEGAERVWQAVMMALVEDAVDGAVNVVFSP